MQRQARLVRLCSVLALTVSAVLPAGLAKAAQAPPCHPANSEDISGRGDIVNLPADLKARLIELANRPHTYVPLQAFAEADSPVNYSSITCWTRQGSNRTSSPP